MALPGRKILSFLCLLLVGQPILADEPIDIGKRLEPFFDDYLIETMKNVSLRLHEPRDAGVVLKFDRPWEGRFCGYCTIIQDGDLYRLYYRGLPSAGGDETSKEVTCYAESIDGVHWQKPNLGLFEVHGTRENNVILADAAPATHNLCPFLDRNPAAKPNERFKALGGGASSGLLGFVSEDGIRWRRLRDEPVFKASGWVFDSQNVAFWSQHEQQYVLYYRSVPQRVRAIARTTSADFINWSPSKMMVYSDTGTDKPSHHLYTNQTQPYFRAPHLYLATAARFMPGRQVLSEEEARRIQVDPGYFRDSSDSVLLTSRGGHLYDRTFLSALIKPGIGAENWVSRSNYPALNIVQTSPTEMSLYVNQNYGQPTAHLRRYVTRLDGLASANATYSGGELLTKPFRFYGRQLQLNFATSAAGGIRVEIQDEQRQPMPGFDLESCQELIGNQIERSVRWEQGNDVGQLAGKTIRLRVVLHDADLYSLRFR